MLFPLWLPFLPLGVFLALFGLGLGLAPRGRRYHALVRLSAFLVVFWSLILAMAFLSGTLSTHLFPPLPALARLGWLPTVFTLLFLGPWLASRLAEFLVNHSFSAYGTEAAPSVGWDRLGRALTYLTCLGLAGFVGLFLFQVWPRRIATTPAPNLTDLIGMPAPPAMGVPDGNFLYTQAESRFQDQNYPESLELFLQAGRAGHGLAMQRAGLMFFDGLGTGKDFQKAAAAFAKALEVAPEPLPESVWKLAWLYESGQGVPRDLDFSRQLRDYALSLSQPGAGLEIKESLEFLAGLWEEGKTGRKDLVKAATIHEALKNDDKALLLLVRASADGDAEALYRVGMAHRLGGFGLPQDPAKAVECLHQAGQKGHSQALLVLATLNEEGAVTGVKDPLAALDCLKKAAETANPAPAALAQWGRHLSQDSDPQAQAQGLKFLLSAYAMEPSRAALALAKAYQAGLGTEPDPVVAGRYLAQAGQFPESRAILLKALQSKRPGASVALAEMYLRSSNLKVGLETLKEACKHGDLGALPAVVKLSPTLLPSADGEDSLTLGMRQDVVALLLKAAEQGEPFAAAQATWYIPMATRGDEGSWPKEKGKLLGLLKARAEAQEAEAQVTLALWQLRHSLERDWQAGIQFCLQAIPQGGKYSACRGYAEALALATERVGSGAPSSLPASLRLLQAAAQQGSSKAWRELAKRHDAGQGVPADPVKAAYCRSRAGRIEANEDEGC